MIFSSIASVFVIVGIYLVLDLTPDKVTEDLLLLMTPKENIRNEARNLIGNKKVKTEILLIAMAYNINKYHSKIQQNRTGTQLLKKLAA